MVEGFRKYLEKEGKSQNTIESYIRHINGFLKWYQGSFKGDFKELIGVNIREYISYLKNVKRVEDKRSGKGKPINAKTINAIVSALIKFNEYLCEKNFKRILL